MEVVALVSAFVVAFVVAFLGTPTAGEDRTRGAVTGALALGMAAAMAAGVLFGAPSAPFRLEDGFVTVVALVAILAPVERGLGHDRPVRVHAVRAIMAATVGAVMLWPRFFDWPLNKAFGAAFAGGGLVYVLALLLDGVVDRRPLWAGAYLGALVAVTIGFVVGAYNGIVGVVGGALDLALVAVVIVGFVLRGPRTERLLAGAPLVVATVLGAMVLRVLVGNVAQDRPPLSSVALLLVAAAGPRVADLLRGPLGGGADAVGIGVVVVVGGIAAALAGALPSGGGGGPY